VAARQIFVSSDGELAAAAPPGHRKDTSFRAGRCTGGDDGDGSTGGRGGRLASFDRASGDKRGIELRRVLAQDYLANGSGRDLSLSASGCLVLYLRGGRGTGPGRDHDSGVEVEIYQPLSGGRLALVPGNIGAGHRHRSSWQPGDGRPVHVSPVDRHIS